MDIPKTLTVGELISALSIYAHDQQVLLSTETFARYLVIDGFTEHLKDNVIVIEGNLWTND